MTSSEAAARHPGLLADLQHAGAVRDGGCYRSDGFDGVGAERRWPPDAMSLYAALHQRLAAAEQALDAMRCAVFVLDARASILFANHAAHALLAEGDGLCRHGAALAACVNGDVAALRAAIAGVGAAALQSAPPRALKIRRSGERPPLAAVMVAARAPRDARSAGQSAGPGAGATAGPASGANSGPNSDPTPGARAAARCALLYVADPGRHAVPPAALLRDAFGLTDRETAVAVAMVRHGSLPAAAAELRVALSTARSHLQHVFDKTGTRTQVALTQMLVALSVLPDL